MRLTATGVALLLLVFYTNNPSDAWTHSWHTGPINCYNCSSTEECAASAGALRKCANNDAQSCVAVFQDGVVIERGCSDNLEETCASEGNSCYECRSHGCNDIKVDTNLIDCLLCDADTDENCVFDHELVTDTRRCNEQCITALYPRTSDVGAPLELVRTCLDDLDYDDRQSCAAGTLENCVACSSNKCNTADIGVRGTCNFCTNGNCNSLQSKTCRAVPADDEREQCYIEVDESGNISDLGCLSQYNISDASVLQGEKRIWTCTGENCNVVSALPTPKTCVLCSSRTAANCAVAPNLLGSATECSHPLNSDCYSLLRDDGHTERGCATTLDSEDYLGCQSGSNSTKCTSCNGDNCNVNIQPADRLSCHVCNSAEDDNCETSPDASALCVIHRVGQQCVSSLDLNGNTVRGCGDSLSCVSTDSQSCQLCSGENCNTVNLQRRNDGQPGGWGQELPLSCLSCNDTTACAANSIDSVACATNSEYCVTVFSAAGEVQSRGCSDVVEAAFSAYCDANDANCHNCNSNSCNNATSIDSYTQCIYCESSVDSNCIADAQLVTKRRQCNGKCMTAFKPVTGTDGYDLVRGCLDDKDPEDQELCAAGSDNNCVACDGDACNVAEIEVERLSCYVCNDDDSCADPNQAVCLNYSPSDRCYMLFDDTASVTAMGCRSDLDADYIEDNFVSLYFCEGNGCNFFTNIPQPNICKVCSSFDDENCAVDPSRITEYENCNVVPNTGCVTRVLTDGSTARGCVSNLATTAQKACLRGEGDCEVCEGEMCNANIYPEDRRSCHRCNSLDDPSCGSSPSFASVCPRYDQSQGCSSKIVNGYTYRGCQTEFTCNDSDKQYCRLCSGSDNCNVVDLDDLVIGYPGKWTTPPINCYTCEGFACQGTSLGALQKCANNDQQNCATVFATNGSVVLRGCTDQLYADEENTQYCDANGANCKFCKSTGCNNARSLDTYVNCVLCDGSEQAACVRSISDITRQTSCQGSCFTGLYPRSRSVEDSPFELARGCLDDLEYDDREACAAGTLENCVACTGAVCNTDDVPEQRLSCNYCADESCAELTALTCTAYRENDQCYIHVGDLKIESAGCASDLERTFLTENRRDLYLCSGDNCNTKDVLNEVGVSCALCNSTAESGCIAGESILAPVCQHYLYPQCYTHITEDGVVQRGCLMDTDDELFDDCLSGTSDTCSTCDSNNCNTQLYPADWQSCLRCDSNSDANCEKQPASYAGYCSVYQAEEGCVTSLENGRTRRGCQSELSCDVSQPGNCRFCENNNCNSINLAASYVGEPGKWQDLPLSCHVCTDAASCATLGTPSTCEGNNKQTCSTVFNEAGVVVARGCSDSVLTDHATYCEANDASCLQCKSNGCNNAQSLDAYIECYHCDAETDEECAWETPQNTRQCQGQCMTGLYPRSSAWDSALLPTRGCLDDLEEADRELCSAGNHANCTACSTALCNTANVIATAQECYKCTSSDCADMSSGKCVAYREHHQCYTAFDTNDIIAMGCASDFETQVVAELVAQQRLLVCDGQNCNNPSIAIPEPNTCLQCSSLNDTRCATNPNQLLTTDICSQLPYTQCITHIDAAGVTTRGCLATVAGDDFSSCLAGTSDRCDICTGSNCNGLSVFPANRRRCHQCDSSSTPACASAPSSSTVCPIYDAEDSCVTTLINDVTYRGCSSSLSCSDPSDATTCRVCSDADGCNTVDLERLHTHGNPGVWQETPIQCLACSSAEGCSNGGGLLETCVGLDNCVTVFDASDAVTSRSCYANLDTTSTSYCDAQPENCPRCNSNGCNVADSLESYVECLVCDSTSNADCVNDVSAVTKTRQCYKGCLTAFRPLFNESSDPSYALVRNCQDDKEAEDSASCGTADNQLCTVCNDAKCNTADLVDSRLSCLSCQGDGCQNPQPASCATYRSADACYIQFDETRSVVAQGCLSEFSNADIYLLRLRQRLISCENNNCNTLESLPDPQSCVLCSSRTDNNCAVTPASVTSATTCSQLGLTQCYTRVLSDGSTERGCLSSLEDEQFLGCYNGTSNDCSSCVGNSCNNQVYPSDRRSCHICNSESDGNCESTPNSLALCPLYAENDQCVTNLRNGITYRSCGSSLTCEPNSKSCVYCEGDGCNVADLSASDDDNHGKWQDLPLSCLTCQDATCQQTTIESARCADNNEQDCVTVFNEAGVVVRRGCEDAIEQDEELASYCGTNAANCPICKSNDCNNATTLTQYNSCIYCDSYKDLTCLWDATNTRHKRRQCQGDCMTALHGAEDSGYDLIRTCLDDKEPADQLTCQAGTDATCAACTGEACNVVTLPAERTSCYHCGDDVDCEDPVTRLCDIYKPNDSCYLWVDNDNDIRQLGCVSSFRNQDVETLIKTKRVQVCEGNNCNTPQLQSPVRCAVCNSRTNASCATTPLAVDNFEVCSQFPYTHCVTQLDDEGATIRGCLFDLPQTDFANCLLGNDPNCEICSEDGCNREIFPADRQRCYTCSSADDSSCESDPSRSSACPWVSQWETCQTNLQNNVTTRGCSSIILCDNDDYRNCRSCVGSECNSIDLANHVDDGQHGLFQALPLKCHTCEGDHCHNSLGPATECTRNVEQDCKTVFEEDGETVRRRGCSDDVDNYEDRYCRQHPELCFTCKSNECNDAWQVSEYTSCLYCNSESEDECVTYPQSTEVATRQCKGKCLVALLENKQLLRSCVDDKEAFDRAACSSDESGTNCATCEDGRCNTFSFPADRLSCHVCTGTGCTSSRTSACLAYDENDFCFAKYNDGAVELMGCASSQNETDLEQWRLTNVLYECESADCNDLTRLPASGECIACDSSRTPNCAQSPSDVETTVTCQAPLSDCVTRLENGNTIRGCLSSLSTTDGNACVANGTCASCAGGKCNLEVFPANRRRCHICNSVANSNCADDPNSLAICPVYAADDTCVATLGSDSYLQRGCGSQLECEVDDEDHCQVCSTDGCNTNKLNGAATIGGIGLVLTLVVSLIVSNFH
ncbi:uncharacterized protein LOC117570904 [Drosophila albomicans]|uniref:Uncharacterized protein LOC117570904 n=1 Tax=Drosophila albomicans TaxID=7291 RepID=A0A6P8XBF8_DROAB|nr:uncharacterized protein LOC117570904 [Drosophila albomicans]